MSRPYGITDDVKTYIDDEYVMISQTYIMFKEMYHFKSLPEQFYLVYNEFNKTWSIEYRAPAICGDFKERYEHIITANASLFNWLQKLEPCDSEYKVVKR